MAISSNAEGASLIVDIRARRLDVSRLLALVADLLAA